MIVSNNKYYETNSAFPNSDWYNCGNYVIDETNPNNQELIQKIKENAPYMELVVKSGYIVDVIPTERPPEPPQPPTAEERVIQLEQSLAETNAMLLEFMETTLV